MSTSQFLIRMVEAGRKNISISSFSADSSHKLRQQLTDLEQELERQRARNHDLERQLQHTAHGEIVTYVKENPGATTPQIIQHIADTVPRRVAGHLDVLEEDTLENKDGEYYLQESDSNQSS